LFGLLFIPKNYGVLPDTLLPDHGGGYGVASIFNIAIIILMMSMIIVAGFRNRSYVLFNKLEQQKI
jgi:hypothetical protein